MKKGNRVGRGMAVLLIVLGINVFESPLRAQSRAEVPIAIRRVQPRNGLYGSADDFTRKQVQYGFADGQPRYHFRPSHPVWGKVRLLTPDTLVRATEDTHWGCRREGRDYRFYKGESYQVLACDGMVLYKKSDLGVNGFLADHYYFSASADGPIRYLDRKNLFFAFSRDPDMTRLLRGVKPPYRWLKQVAPGNRPFILELYRQRRMPSGSTISIVQRQKE